MKIAASGKEALLKPGQQAGLQGNGSLNVKDNVNLDEVVAWKNGLFQFNDADMPAVMRQLEKLVRCESDLRRRSTGKELWRRDAAFAAFNGRIEDTGGK